MAKKMTKKQVRKAWVKALRSGEYKQTIGRLRDKSGFCCLGVLCDLAVKNGVMKSYLRKAAGLPQIVQDWIGLNSYTGDYFGGDACLASDNDDGKSFQEIASIIESEPQGLFE
jgi:hypothetical protein